MADYRFNKPWAADSQNVQDFTAEEWGKGIVEKSLVSSSQVNGIMQAVTERFLDLESVEDKQFRYNFVVDDEATWEKFKNKQIDGALTVLIRGGNYNNEAEIDYSAESLRMISIEYPTILNSGKIKFRKQGCIVYGGSIQSTIDIENANFVGGSTLFSNSITFTNCSITSCWLGGRVVRGGVFTSCHLSSTSPSANLSFENSTIIRCTIPNNTKLTNCTLIDCDYTVDTYTANLVTGTTFRDCNVTIAAPQTTAGAITTSDCVFRNCKLSLNAGHQAQVSGCAYDCEFLGGDGSLTLVNSLFIYGESFLLLDDVVSTDSILDKMTYSVFMTEKPFYHKYKFGSYLKYRRGSVLTPGMINEIHDNSNMSIANTEYANTYFINFTGQLNTQAQYGGLTLIHTHKYTGLRPKGYITVVI